MSDGPSRSAPLFNPDPGWLFVIAGSALLSSVALIPAQDELAKAHAARTRALAVEAHRSKRLENFAAYNDALNRRDETLMKALAAGQLNLAPADKAALVASLEVITRSAGIFGDLEPKFVEPEIPPPPDSLLHALATRPATRTWVVLVGAVSLLYGLLPSGETRAVRRRRGVESTPEEGAQPAIPGAVAASHAHAA